MAVRWLFLFTTALVFIFKANEVSGHGRLMEPVSRASMWRKGFRTPPDYDDNQGFCGGYGFQWKTNYGRCGICGDPYGVKVRQHEAPGGRYARGLIVKEYKVGQVIDVQVDITANHWGYFTFKLCQNNDLTKDSDQSCFDKHLLKVYPGMSDTFVLTSSETKPYHMKVKLPDNLKCSQCILQWTYTAANSWGNCSNGTSAVGCGPQETFRACSDIAITSTGSELNLPIRTRTATKSHHLYRTPLMTEFALPPRKIVSRQKNICRGRKASDDDWCMTNCNHTPVFCPTSHCTCI